MIKTPFLRAYSTAPPLARIVTAGSRVSLHLSASISQANIFARLKQNDRTDVLDKVERSLLWEQMSAGKRRLIFRPSMSQQLVGRDEPITAKFRVGKDVREIELQPKFYDGPPSHQDLHVVVLTCRNAEDVQEAFNILAECRRYKSTSKNLTADLFPLLLRQAAVHGCFQNIYSQLSVHRDLFQPFMNQDFYQEVLRIYALRVPFLSHRSKNMIYRAYRRSTPNVSRNLVMLYAMASYAEKFGSQNVPDLKTYITPISEINESPRLKRFLPLEDVALGIEGLRKTGVSEDDENLQLLSAILRKRGRNRPQIETLAIELSDRHDESEGTDKATSVETEA